MSDLRIFSYLPNPRIWKATIAGRLCGVDVEVRGASPSELQEWLWDFDARPIAGVAGTMAEKYREDFISINPASQAKGRRRGRGI